MFKAITIDHFSQKVLKSTQFLLVAQVANELTHCKGVKRHGLHS